MRSNLASVLCALLLPAALAGAAAAQGDVDKRMAAGSKTAERRVMDSATNRFGLSQVGQIAISVGDLERATGFYRDKLGMKYLFTANGMAFFDNGGIRLMLSRLEGTPGARANSVVYYRVGDIREGYKTLSERGVQFEEPPELAAKTEKFDLWLACFKDSENNTLCLMSEVPNGK
ncbi:MAG TPA: VOC family protein [Pyrinomonadaceae bacterium]|jgi:predicted enzyme related to lactoylglutathione lyase